MTAAAIPIRPFWYSDIFVFPKLITIVTTLDPEGRINAAPYSHIMQYDVMHKTPRILLGFRSSSHTYENIAATGEFVINCPTMDQLDDMMETARFYGDGINELEHTKLVTQASTKVSPPTISDCPQVIECTVDKVYQLDDNQGHVIGKIEAILVDEAMAKMDREERIRAMKLPIGLGDEKRKYYYYCDTENLVMRELADAPDEEANPLRRKQFKTKLEWEDGALALLEKVPRPVRGLVIRQTEKYVKKEAGESLVTKAHFVALSERYGFGPKSAIMDRFETD